MVGFGYMFRIQKKVKSTQKQPSCIKYKKVQPSKRLGENIVKSKVAAINLINSQRSLLIFITIHIIAAMKWLLPLILQLFHSGFLKATPFL